MREPLYVLIDHTEGRVSTVSLESLVCGQELRQQTGGELIAVVLGGNLDVLREQLSKLPTDRVLLIDHPNLQEYTPELYCEALSGVLLENKPGLFLLANSYQNLEMVPRLAARLRTGLVTDCIGFSFREGKLLFTRQMFCNKLSADVEIRSEGPWIITLQAGAFPVDALGSGSPELDEYSVDLSSTTSHRTLLEKVGITQDRVDLSKAEIIIGVGRGIKNEDRLELVKELSRLLNAEIGASRPVVDSGWLERDRQIGSSGQSVSPKLYIAVGISGAIQHVVGIKNSNCIVAINSDRNAPIFNVANYGVVGDLAEILPELCNRLKAIRG